MMNRVVLICQLLFVALCVSLSALPATAQRARKGVITASTTARVGYPDRYPDQYPGQRTRSAPQSASSLERQVFALINNERRKKGLNPLVWNDRVAQVARLHSKNMADRNFFSHRGSDGSMVSDRARRLGVPWNAIGENLVYFRGYSDAANFAVESWMDSKGHKKNILEKRWLESGIGAVVRPDGTYFFTQVFLTR